MRDGIALADLGIPVVALVTSDFEPQADFIARAAGMDDVPRVILPHPIAGTGSARHREVAEEFAEQILAALEGSDASPC